MMIGHIESPLIRVGGGRRRALPILFESDPRELNVFIFLSNGVGVGLSDF